MLDITKELAVDLERASELQEYLERLRRIGIDIHDAVETTSGLLQIRLGNLIRLEHGRFAGVPAAMTARKVTKPLHHAAGSAQEIANDARVALLAYQRHIAAPLQEKPSGKTFDYTH